MGIEREWALLNRWVTGGDLTGEQAVALLRWMLTPDDDEGEEDED